MKRLFLLYLASICVLFAASLQARDKLPEATADGLVLQHQSEVQAVYAKPGANLQGYSKVMLVDAYVAFKKDWQSHYNRTRLGLGEDITDKDVANIKSKIAAEFASVFSEVLTEGGYELTTEPAADVLLVRPAIINLEIAAPDLNKPGMRANIVSSAGFLTLYVELYDSVSNDKLAEVFDKEEAGDRGFGYRATGASNRQALDQVLRHWAGLLVRRLDAAHGKSK